MKAFALAVLTLAALLAPAVLADDVVRGDVVRSADIPVVMCPTPPPTALFSHDLAFKSWVWTGDKFAFDATGVLYSVLLRELDSTDSTLRQIRSVLLQEPSNALAVDAAGFALVVGESGRVYVYSPGGVFQRGFQLPNVTAPVRSISIDVTPDGCTMVYTGDHGAVNRFDSCGLVALPAPDERFDAVRAMADGGFAGASGDRIKFYDAMGRLLYDVLAPPFSPIVAMAFDVDPDYLWIANSKTLVRMRISDRSITARENLTGARAVAVFGERRASAATLPAAPPPRRRGASH